MKPSHNQPYSCGSGFRSKNCCGRISDDASAFSPSSSFMDIWSLESGGENAPPDPSGGKINALLRMGNFPLLEMLLRMSLEKEPNNALFHNFLGWIAVAVNLPQFALHYFSEAIKLAPDWQAPQLNLEKVHRQIEKARFAQAEIETAAKTERFLLIKAWGHGFWADVTHVLSQILLAEITGRVPVIHWGPESRFGDSSGLNAFEYYFESPSDVDIGDLQREDFDFWPPKWNHRNLTVGAVNKWNGAFSRMAGLYLLSRPERVIVSDFYSSVIDLKPWIPPDHHLYSLSVDELHRYLVRRYLRPQKEILDEVNRFYEEHLGSSDFVAVHARGSDKATELTDLDELNRRYKEIIDRFLSVHSCRRIFLMTDDSRLLNYFLELYGDRLVATDCQRTSNSTGVHYKAATDKRRLGEEVMVDVYTAVKAKAFVGIGYSNPSQIMRYLKDWPDGNIHLAVC